MVRKYKELRKLMFSEDVNQNMIGEIIGHQKTYVSSRFRGQYAFDADDMYKILDYFNIPHNQMHIYFPPHGDAEPT